MASRKLLAEIDRTLKKIQEGVEVFDDIWDKVYAATQQSQKEKHESDLKKEIKKLQRYRDSLKGWIANTDIKDNQYLIDARKLIESKMEQFKICERETKTKAYSKEGLAQAAKLDPAAQSQNKCRKWTQTVMSTISDQIDALEADIEVLDNAKGKRKDRTKIDEMEEKIVQHKWHIDNLEMIVRALDNKMISPDEVESLKDDIEYYVESNSDPDFYMDDTLYESLDLEQKLNQIGKTVVVEATTAAISKKEDASATKEPDNKTEKAKSSKSSSSAIQKDNDESRQKEHLELLKAQQERQRILQEQQEKQRLRKEQQQKERELREKQRQDNLRKKNEPAQPSAAEVIAAAAVANAKKSAPQEQETKPVVAPVAEEPVKVAQGGAVPPQQQQPRQQQQPQVMPQQVLRGGRGGVDTMHTPLLAEQRHRLGLLEASTPFMPDVNDSGRAAHEKSDKMLAARQYFPRHPFATPGMFPKTASPLFDNPKIYEQMDADTLFLIFYHQQGTYQQYLAARELKRQSWRYHKKYLTWFQRHEEPKAATNEYEVGTYIYFDYETGWCKRIKSEFTFEYIYLEDDN